MAAKGCSSILHIASLALGLEDWRRGENGPFYVIMWLSKRPG